MADVNLHHVGTVRAAQLAAGLPVLEANEAATESDFERRRGSVKSAITALGVELVALAFCTKDVSTSLPRD